MRRITAILGAGITRTPFSGIVQAPQAPTHLQQNTTAAVFCATRNPAVNKRAQMGTVLIEGRYRSLGARWVSENRRPWRCGSFRKQLTTCGTRFISTDEPILLRSFSTPRSKSTWLQSACWPSRKFDFKDFAELENALVRRMCLLGIAIQYWTERLPPLAGEAHQTRKARAAKLETSISRATRWSLCARSQRARAERSYHLIPALPPARSQPSKVRKEVSLSGR